MQGKLLLNDYLPHAPDAGAQVSIQHQDNCENGTDHKPRLIINREPDGVVKAFCHNCQKGGVHNPSDYVRSVTDILKKTEEVSSLELPPDMIHCRNTKDWPQAVLAELFIFDITYDDIINNRLGYSPLLQRLIIPIYDLDGKLTRWEGRSFKIGEVKYIKKRLPKATDLFIVYPTGVAKYGDSICICEDYISAIRLARTGVIGVALGGVNLPENEVAKLSEISKTDTVLVFLDDDNPTVLKASQQIIRDINPLFARSGIVVNPLSKDPKRYDSLELEAIIEHELGKLGKS